MTAFEAGAAAFAAGTLRAPALDLASLPEGAAFAPWAREWLRGWDTANLAAPIPT